MEEELKLPWDEAEAEPREPAVEEILTVGEVNGLARSALEKISVSVKGEVCGLNTGYAYYVYFDLRDEDASLPAILTQRQVKKLDFELQDGDVVVAEGTLSLYEKQGKYQIRVKGIRPFGEGDMARKIEAIKRKLHSEGLFDDSRKRPLPAYPSRIGVVSSEKGKALRDVLVTLRRRYPPARVFVRGVRVQGEGAVRQLSNALVFFEEAWPVDVVIVARGGGSLQDLEPFNTEELARTVASLRVPVVSGVGHEPDVTITDLVADHRASTPTGAAEAVVPDSKDVRELLAKTTTAMRRQAAGELGVHARHLASMARSPLFRGFEFLLGDHMQRWERAVASLPSSPRRGLERSRSRLSLVCRHPVYRRPSLLLAPHRARLKSDAAGLKGAVGKSLELRRSELERVTASLEALSPLAVLERGYSITYKVENNRVVRSSEEVELSDSLKIRLRRGSIEAEVTEKE